jgi:hypothetical protein
MLHKQNSQMEPINWKFHWTIMAGLLTLFGGLAAAPNAQAVGVSFTKIISTGTFVHILVTHLDPPETLPTLFNSFYG